MDRYYAQSYEGVQSLMSKVFWWMAGALALTGATAYYIFSNPVLRDGLMSRPWLFLTLCIVQLGVVLVLSAALHRMSYPLAFSLYTLYALLTGVTMSSIFVVYTMGSIATTFFVAAGMFATMALYGAFTKADLTSIGTFLQMALWGIILAMVINMFVGNSIMELIIAIVAVIIFAGLTAYDVQRIKEFAQRADMQDEATSKVALLASLMLYLDFINLFLNLLTIMGQRKD
jgi:hypothetical protein